ncbi:MAG: glycosyltransferase family 9 protein [Nitrospirota bacterium]
MLVHADFRRVLIIKPSSLGDVVHALPTLAALRDRFPKAHIAWLVKRQWADLLERADGLDEVWPVEPTVGGWLAQLPRLRSARFDLVVDLQGLLRSGALAWLSGCPVRLGFATAREASPMFYTHKVSVPSPQIHAVDRYLLAATALGATVRGRPEFRLRPSTADREDVTRLLTVHGLKEGTRWIAVNVSARWPTKVWPPERFAALADGLQREGLGSAVLIGGSDERPASQAVRTLMRTPAMDLTGKTALRLLPALLESAALLVTNDSGPMHVAAAVRTPVVALFGATSPVLTGPYGTGHRVLTHQVPCSPCLSRTCRNPVRLECLAGVSSELALEAVRAQLALKPER